MTTRKQREAMTGAYETEQQKIIRTFGLTREEVSRAKTCAPGDPVSDYAGNFAVQAEMIADERNEGVTDTDGVEQPQVTVPETPPDMALGQD